MDKEDKWFMILLTILVVCLVAFIVCFLIVSMKGAFNG